MHEVKLIMGGMLIIFFFWVAPPQNSPWSSHNDQDRPSIKDRGGSDVVLEGLVGGFKPYDDESRLTRANHIDDE